MDIEEIKKWYMEALSKYIEFEGRSRRKELWTFALVNFVISIVLFNSFHLFHLLMMFMFLCSNIH